MRFLGQNTSSITSVGQNFLVAKRGYSMEQLNLGTENFEMMSKNFDIRTKLRSCIEIL